MFYASDFNPRARAAIEWTRDQLNRRDCSREENMRMWNYLGEMKETHAEEEKKNRSTSCSREAMRRWVFIRTLSMHRALLFSMKPIPPMSAARL